MNPTSCIHGDGRTAPRRGRPPADIDTATLPPVARVLRAGLMSRGDSYASASVASGVPVRSLVDLLSGRVDDPRLGTMAAILRAIRPGDKDGGWGWFGRALTKESGCTSPPRRRKLCRSGTGGVRH